MKQKRFRQKLPFSRTEYRERLGRVEKEVEASGLDALLAFDPVSHTYLTGYETMELTHYRCLVIAPGHPPAMITSNFERPGVDLTSCIDDITEYHFWHGGYLKATRDVMARIAPRAERVGVEKDLTILSPERYEGLLASLKGVRIVDASGIVKKLRRVKSPLEIEYTKRASEITSKGMGAAIEATGAGASDRDIASAAYRVMTEAGGEYMCYAPFVTTGRRSGVPHTTYTGAEVLKDDVVFIELGACVKRYSGPLMRTVKVGKVPKEAEANASTLIQVLNEVIDQISPGLTCGEVAERVRRTGFKPVGSRIISPSLIDGDFGYGIGLGFPPTWGGDGPLIAPGVDTVLEPGMTFHLNETLREVARYGLSFSETVVVTKRACKVLTDFPREFIAR